MSQLNSFLETALWSTSDYCATNEGDKMLDAKYSIDDISPGLQKEAESMIDKFLELATPLFTEYEMQHAPIGHDLWLTLEGHGAGFWDGDYEQRDALTEIVKGLGFHDSFWSEKLNESINRSEDNEKSI